MRPAQAPQTAPAGSPEAELVRRARERDEAAIRSILQSNNRRPYRLARGILRNDSEAEDVVQETYVRAFTHLEDFRGDSSLATWLDGSPSTRLWAGCAAGVRTSNGPRCRRERSRRK